MKDLTTITLETEGHSITMTGSEFEEAARSIGGPTKEITRVRYKGEGVEVQWRTSPRDGETIVHELASDERPEPEFVEALMGLVRPLLRLLDLPSDWEEGFVPQTVTVKYEEDGWGLVITSLKKLIGINAPLVINTPYLAERGETTEEIPSDLERAVNRVLYRAERYVDGHREQASLFDGEQAAA